MDHRLGLSSTLNGRHREHGPLPAQGPFALACPICHGPLTQLDENRCRCPVDGEAFARRDGIWHFLPAARADYFRTFMREYETVRQAEGRGSPEPAYYRALPFTDQTGRFEADWRIRSASFRALLRQVVEPLETKTGRPLVVLDLGAGNGWLSNRLAERGHQVAAVDLQTNAIDGLGAHRHYATTFTPIQAEFDALPLAEAQADLVVFNGALHYSTDFVKTLREALRVLRPEGLLAVVDSPLYHDPASGAAMVREREAAFSQRYGFPSNALPLESFLSFRRLEELAETLGVRWRLIKPAYGLRWSLRPWLARAKRRREPATFLVLVAERVQGPPPALARDGLRCRVWRRALQISGRLRHDTSREPVLERVAGHELIVLPQVFDPKRFRSGAYFAERLGAGLVPPGATVLDLGTGSGSAALAAAGRARRVLAVDINPEAVRCARINALLNRLENTVEVRQGDLFGPVGRERFDLILFNPPYYRGDPRSLHDHAWRSPDVPERFAAGLRDHLTQAGQALVILSTDGEARAFLDAFRANGLRIEVAERRDLINEVFTIYRIRP